ncbi:MAG TPA: hypothetical protein VEX18_09760, partial [Polyangiaceae bacterium]|nr:hypothetical protein [Polyangiaceae bacterium]
MLQTARFACFGALGANLLFGCGAPEHFAPPPESSASGEAAPLEPEFATGETREREPAMLGEGLLEIATRSSGPSFLGSTHCVVEDAEGRVVAGADEESGEGSESQVSQLSLLLPAGEAYTLRLTASIEDARSTICRATIG